MIQPIDITKLKVLLRTRFKTPKEKMAYLTYNVITVKQLSDLTGRQYTVFYNALNRDQIESRYPFPTSEDAGPKFVAVNDALIAFLKTI